MSVWNPNKHAYCFPCKPSKIILYNGVNISLHNIINEQDKYIHNQLFGNIESQKSTDWQVNWSVESSNLSCFILVISKLDCMQSYIHNNSPDIIHFMVLRLELFDFWYLIVHSKLLNFDWSRAVQLIPNCIP